MSTNELKASHPSPAAVTPPPLRVRFADQIRLEESLPSYLEDVLVELSATTERLEASIQELNNAIWADWEERKTRGYYYSACTTEDSEKLMRGMLLLVGIMQRVAELEISAEDIRSALQPLYEAQLKRAGVAAVSSLPVPKISW